MGFCYLDKWLIDAIQVRSKHSGCRSQMVFQSKTFILNLYDLDYNDPTVLQDRVNYLLEADRFTCAPRGYDVSVQLGNAAFKKLTTV
jgi:hypothetical protein